MITIIDTRTGGGTEFYARLKERLSARERDVCGDVGKIVEAVRLEGDKALLRYTELFDGICLEPATMKVEKNQINDAYEKVDMGIVEVVRKAKARIESFHMKQRGNSWFDVQEDGVILGQICRPLDTVGVYVPGGTAAYPSSLLMNVIPARIAGVRRIIMATPPRAGGVDPVVLVAANEAGVDEIYLAGGAQAIAAMAYGTQTIPKVDKVVGPGNIYVATAKRLVYGQCDIDMTAGPSEIAVVADDSSDARHVAADLISQSEHDVLASSMLITTSEKLAIDVKNKIIEMVGKLERSEIIKNSISNYGAIFIVESVEKGMDIVNTIAPEHLELCVKEPFNLLGKVKNAGAIFLGHFTPEPVGDYFAGPNHVLPTGGTARFFSALGVDDFIKKSSIISYTEKALKDAKDDIIRFALAEGLSAHANSIGVRFEEGAG